MAQSIMHACTNCGTSVPSNMRFCPNCGAPALPEARNYPQNQPAPAPQMYQQPQQAPPGQQGYQQPGFQPPPVYAQPQKKTGGCLKVGVVLLLLLLIVGAGGFFAFRYFSGKVSNIVNTDTTSAVTPTQAPLTTTPINTTFNYASVTVTILNAQQAMSFADDQTTPAQGVVRLNLHAVQSDITSLNFTGSPVFSYPECFTLLLPGGVKAEMGSYQNLTGPGRKESQTNWIDFPAPTSLKVSQMTLQIGKDTEEQVQVPLTGQANLSQYQPKQSAPNLRVPFGSMFWTLKTATLKLSDSGKQAAKGTRYLVLVFSLDNPGTEGLNAFPPDYIRLQLGGATITSDQTAIGDAAASTTNIPGYVSFIVPQGTTAATFVLLPGHTPGATSQALIPFQIP